MALSVLIKFTKPWLESQMEDREVAREKANERLRAVEERAAFYRDYTHTSNLKKPEFQKATDITQYYEDGRPGRKYEPGRRHRDFSLDEDAPFLYSRRF